MIGSEAIAQEIERQVDEAFRIGIEIAERDGDDQLAARLRLDWLGHALDGFRYDKGPR